MKRIFWFVTVFFILIVSSLTAQEVVNNAVLARTDMPVKAVAWSPDGRYFATSWNNSVILWEASYNTICAIWSGHRNSIVSAKFSNDSHWFLSVSNDNSVIIRNIDEKVSAIKITGDGTYPILDAVFTDNGYSIMAPVDGMNIAHCFRLVMTNQFIFKAVTNSIMPVIDMDINPTLSKLLISTNDGTVTLFDIEEGKKKQTYPRYVESNIGAVFSPDGQYFLSAADKTSLVISPVDGPGAFSIRDSDMPVNSAVYHPGGKKIAVALRNGLVKVYNVADGSIDKAYSILVESGDVVESLAYSPDGESLVAGTRKGYIFRWSPDGKAFVPIRKSLNFADLEKLSEVYSDQTVVRDVRTNKEEVAADVAEEAANEDGKNNKKEKLENGEKPNDGLELFLKFNTVNSKYYYGAGGFGAAYRDYRFFPMYWGFGFETAAIIPKGNYPFVNYDADKYGWVWIYSGSVFGLAGLSFNLPGQDLIFFTEARAGVNVKFSFNNNFKNYLVVGPYLDGQFTVLTGVQWRFLRVGLGTQFDTDLNFAFKASVGYVINFNPRAPKEKKEVSQTETPPPPPEPDSFDEEVKSKF
ncbi:MAG: hypothetical protein IJS09_10505 [Treponema sp.]|nr:hypothetical protein [Treponema sp.]